MTTDRGVLRLGTSGPPMIGTITGQQMSWNEQLGIWLVESVYGNDFQAGADLARTTNATATFVAKATITTPALTGTYRIGWQAVQDADNATNPVEVRLQNTTAAATVGLTLAENIDLATDFLPKGSFANVILAGVAQTFEVQHRTTNVATISGLQQTRIEFWRVAA